MSQHRVFVYGTLMKGLRNHHFMEGARFLKQTATLLPSYEMIQFPSNSAPGHVTPGLLKQGRSIIEGEVYLVDDHGLEYLDAFEDVGQEYERSRIMLQDGSHAWAYFLLADKQACAPDVPSFVTKDPVSGITRWNGLEEECAHRRVQAA